MSDSTTEQLTPRQLREASRAELSRRLVGWLADCGLTQDQLADLVGCAPSKVQKWTDHRNPEVPGAADLALFPRELAARVLRWLSEGHHLTVVDELQPADSARDHLAAIHRMAAADASVTTTYLGHIADGELDPAERRDLILKLRRSIEVERAELCRLELEEVAHQASFKKAARA